eukprot:793784_1
MENNLQAILKFLLQFGWKEYVKIAISTLFIWFIWKKRAKKHKTIACRPGFIPIIGHLHYMIGLGAVYRRLFTNDNREGFDVYAETLLTMNKPLIYSHSFGLFPRV